MRRYTDLTTPNRERHYHRDREFALASLISDWLWTSCPQLALDEVLCEGLLKLVCRRVLRIYRDAEEREDLQQFAKERKATPCSPTKR